MKQIHVKRVRSSRTIKAYLTPPIPAKASFPLRLIKTLFSFRVARGVVVDGMALQYHVQLVGGITHHIFAQMTSSSMELFALLDPEWGEVDGAAKFLTV